MVNKKVMSDDTLDQWIHEMTPYFVDIRQKIHANPELGYQETLTAALVAQELKKMGLDVRAGVGGTGVVAVIDSGNPGKTVALRAELDALPMTEMTALSYKSIFSGKMHACGHDGHTATLLMAANILCQFKDCFYGRVKLIFQPAEEGGGAGAAAMIKAGVLEAPTVDAIFAYHNDPRFPVGSVQTREGTVLSGNAYFAITVYGKGGHAASPELNIDPIFIGAMVVKNLQDLQLTLDSGQIIGVTQFMGDGGCSKNIIPDFVTLGGTLRYPTIACREQMKQQLRETVQQTVEVYCGQVKIEFTDSYPPTVNSVAETQHVFRVARSMLGDERVGLRQKIARASEDFSFYLEKIPGCYIFMGNGENSPSCHNSAYDFNDALLPDAAELLCRIAMEYLNAEEGVC